MTIFAPAPARHRSAAYAGPTSAPTAAVHAATMARQVATVLERTPSFHELPRAEQDAMRRNLSTIASYLNDPAAGLSGPARAKALSLAPPPSAHALADDITKTQSGVKPVQNTGSEMDKGIQNWNAGAANAGSKAMKDQMDAVNFPKFVAGLINGVFNAIVDATIKQMKAYGDMLAAVAKSVDQFAQDHISTPQAQQHVQRKFPNIFDMVNQQGDDGTTSPALKVKDTADEMPDFKSAFGMDQNVDPTDPDGLQKLVLAAQLQLARQRQQQLAAMVMMGVNRIVVTDGKINAKVFIEVKSKDSSTRNRNFDRHQGDTDIKDESSHDGNVWGTDSEDTHETRISTVNVNESGGNSDTHTLDTKAQLTGEVAINFKSDYFPLERLTSAADLVKVQGTANPNNAAGA
jgi:hypothetical protein